MTTQSGKPSIAKVMRILRELEAAKIYFQLAHNRDDGITIEAVVPGERWEIDILEDGTIDFERFVTTANICGEAELMSAIAQYAEPPA
jgi:hypothetical protein